MQDSATPSSVPVVIPGLGVAISADTASAAACIPALPTAAPVPTPPDPPPEPKPKAPPFPRDTQLLQAMCAATARLRAHALPDTELVLTFADVLAGAAGSTEQQAALAMLQDTTNNTRPPTSSTGAWHEAAVTFKCVALPHTQARLRWCMWTMAGWHHQPPSPPCTHCTT